MKTAKEIAQWVIDNRYSKSENEKIDDFVMYLSVEEAISRLLSAPASDLKELKDITDEDAIGVARILNNGRHPNDWSINRENEGVIWIDNQSDDDDNICLSFDGDIDPDGLIYLKAYQYLQSRGYRLPVYFPVQREPDGYEFYLHDGSLMYSCKTNEKKNIYESRLRAKKVDYTIKSVYASPINSVNEKEAVGAKCKMHGCENLAFRNGFCGKHL